MKPAAFDYHAPTTVGEAASLLSSLGDEAKVLAGGQSLVPMLNMRLARFDHLVDIGRIETLREVSLTDEAVTLGAMVRQCDVEERRDVAAAVPLLALATPLIGHFQIRSRGTVGGSIAHADPAAEYPAVALALDADLVAAGARGERTLGAAEFFTGTWSTALSPDELLTAVRFPRWGPRSGFAVEEVARRHGDFAIAGAAVGAQVVEGTVRRASIAMFGVGATPVRAGGAEEALLGAGAGGFGRREADEIGSIAAAGLDPPADVHASSAARRRIAASVVSRAVLWAVGTALGSGEAGRG
ncbi:MAG: FAD binding domain-containing protein [Acidimicrobiales bacterium]